MPVEVISTVEGPDNNPDWPQWRGKQRDGRVAWLPNQLPTELKFEWQAELPSAGVGGIAVANNRVVIGGRDVLDRMDLFQCFDANTGELVWQHQCQAPGNLDYGNSPRATPLIHDQYVYTQGAFGHVHCIELESGLVLWQKQIAEDFQSPALTWGHSGSPIVVANKLILQPGGQRASLVALDIDTGDVLWQTIGSSPSYSSLVAWPAHEPRQVLGYDADSLGAWDIETGKRLWQWRPPNKGDFNVPTPLIDGQQLVLASENNGTRLYELSSDGNMPADPIGYHEDLAPDTHTPVRVGSRLFGIWNELWELSLDDALSTKSQIADDCFGSYGSLIASDTRLLAVMADGTVLLVAIDEPEMRVVSRLSLPKSRVQLLSHPAIVGDSIYLRFQKSLVRWKLQ